MYDCYYVNFFRKLVVIFYFYFRDILMFLGLIYKFNDYLKKKNLYIVLCFVNWLQIKIYEYVSVYF